MDQAIVILDDDEDDPALVPKNTGMPYSVIRHTARASRIATGAISSTEDKVLNGEGKQNPGKTYYVPDTEPISDSESLVTDIAKDDTNITRADGEFEELDNRTQYSSGDSSNWEPMVYVEKLAINDHDDTQAASDDDDKEISNIISERKGSRYFSCLIFYFQF